MHRMQFSEPADARPHTSSHRFKRMAVFGEDIGNRGGASNGPMAVDARMYRRSVTAS